MKGKLLLIVGMILLLAVSVSAQSSPADTDSNGCVDIGEIVVYVELWKNSQVSIGDVVAAVEVWQLGCSQEPICGNNQCEAGETCSSCSQDCGSCGAGIVIAAAGDIAYSNNHDQETADIVTFINPDAVLIPGDLAYNEGSTSNFNNYYDPTWGKFYDITFPAPGNHEYKTSGAAGYFEYWANRFSDLGVGGTEYSFDLGKWHIVSLTDSISSSKRNAAAQWLEQDLASTNQPCILAFMHRPGYSSWDHGNQISIVRPYWEKLYAAKVDVILAGHDHDYERHVPVDDKGNPTSDGMTSFVIGTGGKSLYDISSVKSTSAARYKGYGVLKMVLKDGSFDYEFIPVSGSFSDSGSGTCNSKV